jgi:hypothetical protein
MGIYRPAIRLNQQSSTIDVTLPLQFYCINYERTTSDLSR